MNIETTSASKVHHWTEVIQRMTWT